MATPTQGPYTAFSRIGAGGHAEVYAGVRETWGLKQPVALKYLRPELAAQPIHCRRFKREAEISLSLNHPNIVNTHVLDESGGRPVLVLELVGPSVGAVKESLVGRWDLISAIAEHAFEALGCLRRQGVVHRDISTGNLLIDPSGDVKLADFGVATRYDGTDTPTAVAGSIPFVSPELLRGERGTDASDIFSIGAVLFELGTGETPFGTDLRSVVEGHRQGTPPMPSSMPRHWRALFRGLLEMEPQQRLRLEEAKRLLRPTAAAAHAELGGLSRPWFKECCPAVRHPLDGVRTYGAAVELPTTRSRTRWRGLVGPGIGAAATACAAAALWLVMEQQPMPLDSGAANTANTMETRAELGQPTSASSDQTPGQANVTGEPAGLTSQGEPAGISSENTTNREAAPRDRFGSQKKQQRTRSGTAKMRAVNVPGGIFWHTSGAWEGDSLVFTYETQGTYKVDGGYGRVGLGTVRVNVTRDADNSGTLKVEKARQLAGKELTFVLQPTMGPEFAVPSILVPKND